MFLVLLPILLALPNVDPAEADGVVFGDYLEARTCDVWTGPCFANAEMNEAGREATLAWRVRAGGVGGVDLSGLAACAVLRGEATLGDPFADPGPVRAVLFVDEHASEKQRGALVRFVHARLAAFAPEVVAVLAAPIELVVGDGRRGAGAARLTVGGRIDLETRRLTHGDCVCGNEVTYYAPLASDVRAEAAFATVHHVRAPELSVSFREDGARSAFVGGFRAPAAPRGRRAARRSLRRGEEAPFRLVETPAEGKEASPPPHQVPEAFRRLLDPRALRFLDAEGVLYELWFVREATLRERPRRAASCRFPRIEEGAFLGVLRSSGRQVDYREDPVDAGLFALRYAVQPEDGDHLGTAPSRDFLILTSFRVDRSPEPVADAEALVDLALESSDADHPIVFYLDAPEGEAKGRARLYRPDGRDEWALDVVLPARVPGAKKEESLRLGVVLVGVSENF